MDTGRIIVNSEHFALTLQRLSHQLIEEYDDFSSTCIIGVQPRGIPLSDRVVEILLAETDLERLDYGKLDITFYRDDFRRRERPLEASVTEIDFLVENKKVILVDDVLYTGRTIQAALTALNHYGRPARVDLLVMVDRRFNRHLPIQATWSGIRVDALEQEYVRVEWAQDGGIDQIRLFGHKPTAP